MFPCTAPAQEQWEVQLGHCVQDNAVWYQSFGARFEHPGVLGTLQWFLIPSATSYCLVTVTCFLPSQWSQFSNFTYAATVSGFA